MKNTSFFPFERNRYFYGKLLSVEDFELEQKYVNDKRRMLNRFLCGSGVIAGLNVVEADEQTVSLETGIALDSWGREIVVDVPVIKKLPLLEGFDACADEGTDFVYLCIEYAEKEVSPVHSITGRPGGENGGDEEFGKIRESYRLYVTGEEPVERDLSCAAFYEETTTVCFAHGIFIRQVFPRFVKAGEEFEIRVEVENPDRRFLSFSYDLEFTCLSAGGKDKLTVSFDEMMLEKKKRYELTFRLNASQAPGAFGTARVAEESFQMFLDKLPAQAQAGGSSAVRLTEGDGKEALLPFYRRSSMEEVAKRLGLEKLYLARIYLTKAGDVCLIDGIEVMPFRQYIVGNPLNTALTELMLEEMLQKDEGGSQTSPGGRSREKNGVGTAFGRYEFDLENGAPKGKKFFSGEIFHDLGPGKTEIILGVESGEEVLSGKSSIFGKGQIQADLAAGLDEEKGSFVIGMQLLETVTEGKLAVRWTAVKLGGQEEQEQSKMRIRISPGLLELGLRESYYLEAAVSGMADKSVVWSVREEEGAVDSFGCYTSPGVPGVYEVTARSAVYPEIKASIFVVVRGGKQAEKGADRRAGERDGR